MCSYRKIINLDVVTVTSQVFYSLSNLNTLLFFQTNQKKKYGLATQISLFISLIFRSKVGEFTLDGTTQKHLNLVLNIFP